MPIAKDTEDLTRLLYGSAARPTITPVSDAAPIDTDNSAIESEPIFKYDHDSDKRTLMKQARKTVMSMAEHVLQKDMLEEDYVKNKIEQDVNTLTELLINRRTNELVMESLVNSISKGNTAPKMYEMYTKLQDTVNENNKQILATEDNLRKTYGELKYEVLSKRAEAYDQEPTLSKIGITTQPSDPNKLSSSTYTGTKSLLEKMKDNQRKLAKKSMEAEVVSFE